MEENCILVSSRGICNWCDIHPLSPVSDQEYLDGPYNQIKQGDTVYVVTTALRGFFYNVLPSLQAQNISIKLITGASVRGPQEVSAIHGIDYISAFSNSPHISHWYAQNYDLNGAHSFITPIPLGIDYHTLQRGDHAPWGAQKTAQEQEVELQSVKLEAPRWEDRKDKSFSYFHFVKFERHGRDRYKAIEALKDKSFNDFLSAPLKRLETWRKQSSYKYLISPHGNGLDCHRTYEALALGCVPVVKTSSLDWIYEALPIIILDKWRDISLEKLTEKYEEIKNNSLERLQLRYWTDLIGNEI